MKTHFPLKPLLIGTTLNLKTVLCAERQLEASKQPSSNGTNFHHFSPTAHNTERSFRFRTLNTHSNVGRIYHVLNIVPYLLGPSSLIAISMYQQFGASDISPIQSFGVSIQFRHTHTLIRN